MVIYGWKAMEHGELWLKSYGKWWFMVEKLWNMVIYGWKAMENADLWVMYT